METTVIDRSVSKHASRPRFGAEMSPAKSTTANHMTQHHELIPVRIELPINAAKLRFAQFVSLGSFGKRCK
eukprot:767718-Hanusia_phi.AAC.2